jgi:hypothetical protein
MAPIDNRLPTDQIYASEIEITCEAITRDTGIQLEGFIEFFKHKWHMGK